MLLGQKMDFTGKAWYDLNFEKKMMGRLIFFLIQLLHNHWCIHKWNFNSKWDNPVVLIEDKVYNNPQIVEWS